MDIRKSTLFLAFSGIGTIVVTALLVFAPVATQSERERITQAKRILVRDLHLTDLCLFPEARYTRHLSQADFHAPFQDHPAALEHFPSGSLVPPPPHLRSQP